MSKRGPKSRKTRMNRAAACLTLTVAASQLASPLAASADDLVYQGTTQIATTDCYLSVDSSKAKLVVEEVYAEAGSSISEGDKILKVTDDSYQDAVDYYEASIIKADNTITDTQLEVDQGKLESEYTYEKAKASAEAAEFVRTYQTDEVANALKNHEETLEKIDERIAELEEGIADGSYDASSSGGSGGGATGSSSGGSTSGTGDNGSKPDTSTTSEVESMVESTTESGTESAPGNGPESGTESAPGNGPESGTESAPSEVPGAQPTDGEQPGGEQPGEEQPTDGDADGEGGTIEDLKAQIAEKESELTELASTIQTDLEAALADIGSDDRTNAKNDYSTYTAQLENVINELQQDINLQNQAKETAQATTNDENAKATVGDLLDSSVSGNASIKASLEEVRGKLEKYQLIINTMMGLLDDTTSSVVISSEQLSNMTSFIEKESELMTLYTELATAYESEVSDLETQLAEQSESNSEETPGSDTDQQPGNTESQSSGPDQQPGSTESQSSGPDQQPGNTESQPGSTDGTMPSGNFPSMNGTTDQNGSTDSTASGQIGSMPSGSGFSAGSMSGFSMSGSSGEMPSTASTSGMASGEGMGNFSFDSDTDISLLGTSFDLSETESLLEREPSSSDDAEDLIKELKKAREDVEIQYAELTRSQEIYALKIQYTYDTAILEEQLAEITYQQELEEWNETMAEAEQTKTDLESAKAVLDEIEDGLITSDRSGTIAAIGYDAEDTINGATPIIQYYKTDVVTISIEVPQDEISLLSVGETVDVTINGRQSYDGTITEIETEAESGTSRTSINYIATVSVDNESGRISSGVSATVTVAQEDAEE